MRLIISIVLAAALACAQTATGVDIAWKVLPRRVTADNFGSRVAKLYFGVVAVVGNNSGRDLHVSSILFRLPNSAGLTAPIPSDTYRLVRGTIEREHQVGLRNSGISVIKAVGPILAGATAFYGGASFPRIVDLFSNPFEKGVEVVFPDKTLPQMASLDSLAFRDGAVISDNSQQSVLVFVSRDLLVTAANRRQLKKSRGDFEPLEAMHALGELVLVGKSISYIERITVTAGSLATPAR